MDVDRKKPARRKREENRVFTVFVHVGYSILILSMLGWMIYMEFFM